MIRRLKLWRRKSGVSLLSFFSCLSTQLWLVHHSHFILSDVCRPIKVRRVGCSYGCWPSNPGDVATASPTASGQQNATATAATTTPTPLTSAAVASTSIAFVPLATAGPDRRHSPPRRLTAPNRGDKRRQLILAVRCVASRTKRPGRRLDRRHSSGVDNPLRASRSVTSRDTVPGAVVRRYRAPVSGAFEDIVWPAT